MNEHPTLQLIGSLFMAILAGLLFRLALRKSSEEPQLRLGLTIAASFVAFVVVVRMCALWGWLGQEDARVLNGLIALIFGIALLQVTCFERMLLRWRRRRGG